MHNIKEYLSKSANAIIQNKDFHKFLLDNTSFLNILNPPLKFRLLCFSKGITKIPLCNCGNHLQIEKSRGKTFTKFCSNKCRNKFKKIKRIDKESLQDCKHLPLMEIARKFNIKTPQLIDKWFSYYGIKRSKDYLNDKNWLNIKYSKEKLTIYEISDLLKTSPSTVSVYLNKHNIKTRDISDYEIHNNFTSKKEREIYEWLKSLGFNVIKLYRKLGIELDIYLPDQNFAIEYNGLYWHTEQFKGKNNHKNKFDICSENNIKLLQIWEDDWKNNKSLLQSMILNNLHVNKTKIYARKCNIQEILLQECKPFLIENHIQGKDRSGIKLGLYFEDELVSVMTFSKPRFNSNYDWELIRFCSKRGYTVIGGASKLLKHFKKLHNGSIISYSDNDYSNGNLYKTLGFKKNGWTKKYYWTKNLSKYTRYKFRRNGNLTENEYAEQQGFRKIWTSGITSWILV